METVRAFQMEYAEALQVEDPMDVSFKVMRAMSVTLIAFSRNRSHLPFLTKVLWNDPSPLIRRRAAHALRLQSEPVGTIFALITMLQKDPDPGCRRAAEVLGASKHITAARALARALGTDSTAVVRLEALKTIKWLYIALDIQTPETAPQKTAGTEFAYDPLESSIVISSESLTGSSGSPVTAMTLMVIFSESISTRQ